MSIPRSKLEWMKCLRGADLTDAQFRVLIMLSTYANANGKNAHPGTQRLADDCGLTRRAVQKSLRTLEETGWVSVGVKGGNQVRKGFATVYTLSVGRSRANLETPRVNEGSSKGERTDAPSGHVSGLIDHSEGDPSASLPPEATTHTIQPKTRDWSSFENLDRLEAWLDEHVPGWRSEHDAEDAVIAMWERGVHPKAILEYIARQHGRKLAA